jgi:hypothetical protein
MKKFEEGKRYYCRSLSDYDTVYVIEVICRTAKRLTYQENGKVKRAMVSDDGAGAECFHPHGRYSMCAVIHADHEINPLTPETAKTASLVMNINFPEWGTWGFKYQEQPLSEGRYADIIWHRGGRRVLFDTEYQQWGVVCSRQPEMSREDRAWVEGRVYSGATPEAIREEAERTGVSPDLAAAMQDYAAAFNSRRPA